MYTCALSLMHARRIYRHGNWLGNSTQMWRMPKHAFEKFADISKVLSSPFCFVGAGMRWLCSADFGIKQWHRSHYKTMRLVVPLQRWEQIAFLSVIMLAILFNPQVLTKLFFHRVLSIWLLVSFWFSSIINCIASLLATSKDFDTHTGM